MKFATSRLADKPFEETEQSDTVWLRRARVGAKRPGDFLVVVLSAGLILTLGLVVVIARLEPPTVDSASRVAAVQQPVMRTSPAAQAAPPPVALASPPAAAAPASAAATSPAAPAATPAAPRAAAPVTTASVPTAQAAAPSAPAGLAPLSAPVTPPPLAQPIEVSRQAPPRAGARFDPALAFAAPTFPTGALPPEMAPAPDDAAEVAAEVAPAVAPEPPQRTARLAPAAEPEAEPVTAPPARQTGAQSGGDAGEPVARKGSAGATWAVYFDQFPDQAAAAARINAMQSKYGPYLGGRTLTYTRSGGDWRLRVSGLTEEAARGICDKVKSAGSNCAVGGR